jgi:hypothetical protein
VSHEDRDRQTPAGPGAPRSPYSRPCITWRQPYEPVAFGISCAKQPGNPPCNVGPTKA